MSHVFSLKSEPIFLVTVFLDSGRAPTVCFRPPPGLPLVLFLLLCRRSRLVFRCVLAASSTGGRTVLPSLAACTHHLAGVSSHHPTTIDDHGTGAAQKQPHSSSAHRTTAVRANRAKYIPSSTPAIARSYRLPPPLPQNIKSPFPSPPPFRARGPVSRRRCLRTATTATWWRWI